MGLLTFVPQCDRYKCDYYYVLTRLNHIYIYTFYNRWSIIYHSVKWPDTRTQPLFMLEFTNIVDVAKGILSWTKIMKLLYTWKKLFT